jgi:hypothetical protein
MGVTRDVSKPGLVRPPLPAAAAPAGVALNCKEWMKGYIGLGAASCDEGAEQGHDEGTRFEHGVTIRIADIDRFVAEQAHEAEMDGYVECARLGGKCEFTGGTFHMFVDAADPLVKYMFYRMPFVNPAGDKFTVLGHKTVRNDRGLDLWTDITTLEIEVFAGHDVQGPMRPTPALGARGSAGHDPIARGVIRIELLDGIKSALSFESPGASRVQHAAAVKTFCMFYGSRLWDLFVRLRPGEARASEWTATEAFEANQKLAPVKWLLAGDLLRRANQFARSVLANELDIRDWMTQERVIDLRHSLHGKARRALDTLRGQRAADSKRGALATGTGVHGEVTAAGEDEIWFDYIADTGDDPQVMYAIATLLGKRIKVDEIELGAGVAKPSETLEVGPFVFVGGDTAYHVADETTLRARFVEPFKRAIGVDGKVGQTIQVTQERLLFGIPGNHDYYDNLVGFNRMFRRPFHESNERDDAVLHIPGYELRQEASYVKILLPGDWELWGVDLAHGLDYRQWQYFGTRVPDKLILCVPTPPVTFDAVRVPADPEDPENKAYRRLFGVPEDAALSFAPKEVADQMKPGACRLHLAGDDHHYARYDEPSECAVSVVSGGGGAFLHPTEMTRDQVQRSRSYPTPEQSSALSSKLLNPLVVWSAGLVYLVAGILGTILCATFPSATSPSALVPAALWLAALTVGSLSIYAATRIHKRVAKARKTLARALRPQRYVAADSARRWVEFARRSLWTHKAVRPVAWVVAFAIALSIPFVARQIDHRVDPLSATSVFFVLGAALVLGLALLARARGASWLLGVLHAVASVALPVSLVVKATPIGLAVAAGLCALFLTVAGRLYRRGSKWWLCVTWVLQGVGAVVALWVAAHYQPGAILLPDAPWVLPIAFGIAAIVTTAQFGWYLLVAAAFGAHNNEVGAALRTTKYKQWIRFHVKRDEVIGYVIGLDDPRHQPRPKLVDVFRVKPKQAVPTAISEPLLNAR